VKPSLQLPERLSARTRTTAPERTSHVKPAWVLYWMRVAVRGHDNPALAAACHLANALDVPLLVYHALSERYPYASDRHHTFILQGAKDVAEELRSLGIPYALHVERPGQRGPHLLTLAARAGMVVTELVPTSPLREWTCAVAKVATVVEVDASCVAPMPSSLKAAPTRAFVFRKAIQKLVDAELASAPYDAALNPSQKKPLAYFDLPFLPVDLDVASISELVGGCSIDHGVAPVPDSTGGSVAGYKRWQAFCRGNLLRYASTRNDPILDTTSRMSAYLHYGHVSPFRLLRDLMALRGNRDAEKFVDELVTWRELAWHYCFHEQDHDRVACLPAWATETLAKHQGDERIARPGWDALCRGQSPDEFWNACQASLLAHGELHNNLRMTWGKKLLEWTDAPESALGLLIDLNHRYALDGRDPSSFGGILWCLGVFDRPFQPEAAVTGVLRPRPTEGHQARMPFAKYEAFARRSPFACAPRIAVVGSGVSGLAVARTLANHNLQVTVFDKGYRVGGRLVSRTLCGVPFDYGAQYFTARTRTFEHLAESLVWEGTLAHWALRTTGADLETRVEAAWYVAPLGFSALADKLANGLVVRQKTTLTSVERSNIWELIEDNGSRHAFDVVILALPAAQARALVREPPAQRMLDPLGSSDQPLYRPCWSVTVAISARDCGFDAARWNNGPLAWASRETSKPGREARDLDVWTLHASPLFTQTHYDASKETVLAELLQAFQEHAGASKLVAIDQHVHRWRYAQSSGQGTLGAGAKLSERDPIASSCSFFDDERGLGLCGDSYSVSRVEGAYLSGVDMAGRVLRWLAASGAGTR
jgi:photolyase PhrII